MIRREFVCDRCKRRVVRNIVTVDESGRLSFEWEFGDCDYASHRYPRHQWRQIDGHKLDWRT